MPSDAVWERNQARRLRVVTGKTDGILSNFLPPWIWHVVVLLLLHFLLRPFSGFPSMEPLSPVMTLLFLRGTRLLEDLSWDVEMTTWAFLSWGQHEMDFCFDQCDDVDAIRYVTDQFLAMASDLPMWDLLYQREGLGHARPPLPTDVTLPDPMSDTRAPRAILAPWTSRRLVDCPKISGVPAVLDAGGHRRIYAFMSSTFSVVDAVMAMSITGWLYQVC